MVLWMSLWTPVAQGSTILFWTKPSNQPMVRHRYGATAWSAGLGQYEGILQACASVPDGRVRAGDLHPISFPSFPRTSLLDLWAFIPNSSARRQLWLLMVWMLRAVGASSARSAASVPHVPHQAGYQEPTLAINGVATPNGPRPTLASFPSAASFLLIYQQTKFPKLQILPNDLLLLALQFCQLLKIQRHLLTHNTGTEAAQTLPLTRHSLALLPVIVQKTAQVSQFPIVILQLLVYLLHHNREHKKIQKVFTYFKMLQFKDKFLGHTNYTVFQALPVSTIQDGVKQGQMHFIHSFIPKPAQLCSRRPECDSPSRGPLPILHPLLYYSPCLLSTVLSNKKGIKAIKKWYQTVCDTWWLNLNWD